MACCSFMFNLIPSCPAHGIRETNCENDTIIISRLSLCSNTANFIFSCSLQKRAKKIEGETIYIRHSNLMLEVCIENLEISHFCCCMSHCMRTCFIYSSFILHSSHILSLFVFCSLILKAWHALFSSLTLMQVLAFIYSWLQHCLVEYMIGSFLLLPLYNIE